MMKKRLNLTWELRSSVSSTYDQHPATVDLNFAPLIDIFENNTLQKFCTQYQEIPNAGKVPNILQQRKNARGDIKNY